MMDVMIPVLNPANLEEMVDFACMVGRYLVMPASGAG